MFEYYADFEDMSCEMIYGQVPPTFEEDAVSKQACFKDLCKHSIILIILQNQKWFIMSENLTNTLLIQVPWLIQIQQFVPNYSHN